MSLKIEGHLTSKSSPLAPVSCKLSKQFIVQQHLNAHYKNISNAKPSVDNKCPKSWYKHVNVKDQIRKERLIKSAREHARERELISATNQSKTFRSEFDEDNNMASNDRAPVELMKPIGPRIYQKDVKSKIAQLRCYNPPKKRVSAKPVGSTKMSAAPVQEPVIENSKQIKLESTQKDEEDLKYYSFCNDVTNDILMNNIYSTRGINKIFDEHIQRNKYNLKMDQMLIAYENIRKELEARDSQASQDILQIDKKRLHNDYNYDVQPFNILYEGENRYKKTETSYFSQPELDMGKNHYFTGDSTSIFETYRAPSNDNEEGNYLASFTKDDFVIDEPKDEIQPKIKQIEYSTAPSVLQYSLTSTDDYDGTNSKLYLQNSQLEQNMKALNEEINNINIKENSPIESSEENNSIGLDNKSQQSEENNQNKNVHFANHNEFFSADENDDHSLTDVTSMRLEESEEFEENNDSTCVESSLDLNNTFKSDVIKNDKTVTTYEDDFDD